MRGRGASCRFPEGQRATHPWEYLTAQALELLWVTQELNDFFDFLLGLFNPRDIFKRNATGFFCQELGARLAKAHRTTAAALHLTHEENPDTDNDDERQPGQQHAQKGMDLLLWGSGDAHTVIRHSLDQIGVIGCISVELRTIAQRAGDFLSLDGDVLNLIAFHLGYEVGKCELLVPALLARALKQIEKGNDEQGDDHPKCQVSAEVIQGPSPYGLSSHITWCTYHMVYISHGVEETTSACERLKRCP